MFHRTWNVLIALVAFSSTAYAMPDCGLYQYRANIVKVIDGDTVRADIDLGFNTWKHNETLRLVGIDTPEIRGKERPDGLRAKAALEELLQDKEITICTVKDKQGKYGRFLAYLWAGNINANQWLLTNGYAKAYQ